MTIKSISKQEGSTSTSLEKSINNLRTEMNDLNEQLKGLSSQDIIGKISFLESKYVELRSISVSFDYEYNICISSGNPKEIEGRKQWFDGLRDQLNKTDEIWKKCHNLCRDVQFATIKKIIEKPVDLNHESSLRKLNYHLKQLSLNPLITGEQKEIVQNIQNKLNQALIQKNERKDTSETSEVLPVHSIPSHQENVEESLKLGCFDILPLEVLLNIFSELSPKDLVVLAQTNKSFQQLCNNPTIWQTMLSKQSNNNIKTIKSKAEYQQYIISRINFIEILKKEIYTTQTLCPPRSLFGTHRFSFYKHGNFLHFGIEQIKTLDLTTNLFVNPLQVYRNFTCFCINGNSLYLGTFLDGKIRIYDLTTNQCVTTLQGRRGTIQHLCINGNFLYSVLHNGTIDVWDLTTNQCVTTLQEHGHSIQHLCIRENFLYCADDSNTIKIYNLTTHKCIATERHNDVITSLCIEGRFLYFGSYYGTINIMDLTTKQCTVLHRGNEPPVSCLHVNGNFLYSVSSDGVIKIWDLTTKQCVGTLQGPQNITDLWTEGNFLYSVSSDGVIKIWNFDISRSILLEAAQGILDRQDFSLFASFEESSKKAVYNQLRLIGQFPSCDHAKNAFLDQNDVTTTNEKRAQAIYRCVAKNVISLFKKDSKRQALILFKKLPEHVKNDIYTALDKIVEWNTDSPLRAEKAFLGNGQEITDIKRIQAIQNYLAYPTNKKKTSAQNDLKEPASKIRKTS
ncbi:MAG TPA: F-box/WD40 repeat-containing protein [Rhabdochlamydiaceae bacterium]|nr:F-box/WD40 repeat-containing protein [Rhabdochlamydiaceae bacterium]